MRLPDEDVIFRAAEMGKTEADWHPQVEPSPVFAKIEVQIDLLRKQLEIKEKELEEAKQAAKEAKRYNRIAMFIAIVSMLVSIASWLLPNVVGG